MDILTGLGGKEKKEQQPLSILGRPDWQQVISECACDVKLG